MEVNMESDVPHHVNALMAQGSVEMDNTGAITEKIKNLYGEMHMRDVILVVNGREFSAHSLILCASSEVFTGLLANPGWWNESRNHRVTLTESLGGARVFDLFLKYLYTGKVVLSLYTAIGVLELADKYAVKDLISLCLSYMENHIALATANSKLVRWYQYLVLAEHRTLAQLCQNLIKWNMGSIVRSDDFHMLDPEQMAAILYFDDIVVDDEFTLFSYVSKWIAEREKFHNLDGTNFRDVAYHVLSLIRYPMMSPRQLADLLLIPVTQNYKEFLMDQMSLSMLFHSGSADLLNHLVKDRPARAKLFTPRLYIADLWSIGITIPNIDQVSAYQKRSHEFSTPRSFCDLEPDKQVDWAVDLFPRGVAFLPYYLIAWETLKCPGTVKPNTRLAVTCKEDDEKQYPLRVQISTIIFGNQNGVDHVRSVHTKKWSFTRADRHVNIDDILPHEAWGIRESSGTDEEVLYMTGKEHKTVEVRIVITPINDDNILRIYKLGSMVLSLNSNPGGTTTVRTVSS